MDSLLQIFIMLASLALMASAGSLIVLMTMVVITYVTKDKYYFRKILKKIMED